MTHPEFEMLLAYSNQQLGEDEQMSIKQHLTACQECQTLLINLQTLARRLQENEKASPRPELIRRATAAFRQFQQRLAERHAAVADLQFDSWDDALLDGVRGYTFERQLLYHAVGVDVDVQITPDERRLHRVEGQILRAQTPPELLEGVAISLRSIQDEQPARQTFADYLGRFAFSDLPTGQFLLQIDLSDTVVQVGTITIDSEFEL